MAALRSAWLVLFYVLGSATGFNKWAGLLNDWTGFDAALKPETLKSIRHALEQANDDPNDDSLLRAEMLIRMPAPAERPPLPGELPADEGTDRQPLQRAPATPEGVAALFAKLAALHPTEGFHHRCLLGCGRCVWRLLQVSSTDPTAMNTVQQSLAGTASPSPD